MTHAKRGRRELGVHGRVVVRAVGVFLRHDLSSHLGTLNLKEIRHWQKMISIQLANIINYIDPTGFPILLLV